MTKPGDKDWASHEEWLKAMPKKRVSAGMIFLNEAGEVLLVKPSYKDYWVVPGGVTEQFESPQKGCVREVLEETGLHVTNPVFIGVIHAPRRGDPDDVLHFFFYGGVLPYDTMITLQAEELTEYKFVSTSELQKFMAAHVARQFSKLLEAIQSKQPVYIEEAVINNAP